MELKKKVGNLIEKLTIKNLNKEITKHVSGKRVLDNGCGNGSFIYEKHSNKEIYGIDINKRDIIKRGAVGFKLASSEKIPYKKTMFDCVVFAGVIQYLKDYAKSLKEINRVLKKSGKLIIATVNRDSLFRRIRLINPAPKKEAGEYNIFSWNEMEVILKKHGFVIEKEIGVDFMPLPKKFCSNTLIIARKIK